MSGHRTRSLPPSAPVDRDALIASLRSLFVRGPIIDDPSREEVLWNEAIDTATAVVQAALALPPSGIAEMVREMCAAKADETRVRLGSPTGSAYDNGLWDQSVRIASAIRSLDLPGMADAWQPIETAPKDGPWFLAWQDGQIYPCEWHAEQPIEGPPQAGWYDHFNLSFEEPTHWRPLPVPPADLSNKGVG
jgi:hypothetical protein